MSRRAVAGIDESKRHIPSGRGGDAAFRRAFGGTVAVLVVFCLAFLGLTTFQGPKLSSAVVDTEAVVQESGQQLRLFANQQVAQVRPEQVTVTPAADVSISTLDDVISVTFDQRLHYGADYVVEVEGVTSVYQDRPATFRYGFSTGAAPVYLLDRAEPGSGEPDQIVTASISADRLGPVETVYAGEGILDFAVAGQAIAVVTAADDGSHALSLVSAFDGAVEQIELPGPGTIEGLRANPTLAVGFQFTSAGDPLAREFSQSLLWMDLEGVHTPEAVSGMSEGRFEVADWRFVAATGAIVALGVDQTLLRIDPRGEEPTIPLGTWEGLDDVAADGSTAIVRDVYDTIIYSLSDGTEQPFGPTPIDGQFPFGGQVALLGDGPERVQKVSLYDPATGVFSSRIVLDDGVASRPLYESETGRGSVEDVSVSPNGQFVAVEYVPDLETAVSDAYYPFARADTIMTAIVDIASGAVVAEVPGFAIAW